MQFILLKNMASPTVLCVATLLLISSMGLFDLCMADPEYPGVIEIVGYSNRRARTHFAPVSFRGRGRGQTDDQPPSKVQADIETVKQNIEKYNKLLTLDTKNLPESQKDMLERIVERVARLKESLDVVRATTATLPNRTVEAVTSLTTDAATDVAPEAETNPTLVFDETTLLQLQTSAEEYAPGQGVTAQTTGIRDLGITTEQSTDITADDGSNDVDSSREYESTTETLLTDATDADQQFVAARSNNRNIAAITASDIMPSAGSSTPLTTSAGNQRTLSTNAVKTQKTRATKRPLASSSTKATSVSTSKRVGGQRPGLSTVALRKQSTSKQKFPAASITTTQPNQKVKIQQQQQQKVTEKFAASATTPNEQIHQQQRTPQAGSSLGSGAPASGPSPSAASYGAGTEMIYDAHVNTSAIIDSLNQAREDFYQQKVSGTNKDKKPSATAKPTKYHYYPHNQHIYMLPECAIQQVCSAVYVRLNYTQPLCACPSRYRDPCSASLNEDDQHTTKLVGDGKKKAITLAKTCEDTKEMRECRSPKDWSLLALQNTRTGKSHYLVICRCPDHFKMEGPMAHDQPTYPSVPGIRVFGMMCVKPGFSIRKPSVQPPKRYQLQKPFYRPNTQSASAFSSGQYISNKDAYGRPTYGGAAASSSSSNLALGNSNENNAYHHHQSQNYQSQHHSNYQYLNRPEHSHNNNNNYHQAETLGSIGGFNGGSIYGRNNERQGEPPIQAAGTGVDDEAFKTMPTTSAATSAGAELRTTDADGKIEATEEAVTAAVASVVAAATPAAVANPSQSKREKRALASEVSAALDNDDSEMPEFPWDRVKEFQQSIVWD